LLWRFLYQYPQPENDFSYLKATFNLDKYCNLCLLQRCISKKMQVLEAVFYLCSDEAVCIHIEPACADDDPGSLPGPQGLGQYPRPAVS